MELLVGSARANPAIIGPSAAVIEEAVNTLTKSATAVQADPQRRSQIALSVSSLADAHAKFNNASRKAPTQQSSNILLLCNC